MSLANRLLQEAQDRDLSSKRAKEDALIQHGRQAGDYLTQLLKSVGLDDLSVTFLSSVEGQHPVRRHQQFGGDYIATGYHRLYRVRIDDVTAAIDSSSPKKIKLVVESHCSRCNDRAYGRDITISEPRPESSYTSNHADEIQKRFLSELGDALKASPLCWNCAAEVGDACSTCNRPYTADEVWAKDKA